MTTPARARGEIKAAKAVSESVRERETFRYEPSLFKFHFNDSGKPLDGVDLETSKDSVLTALAQLGTYQTQTERALVSLFDTSHQYIVAEAVPSLPLNPGLANNSLWLCGTAVPRGHWVCDSVVMGETNSPLGPGKSPAVTDLPFTMVRGLSEDERFRSMPYCQLGESSPNFYAAVPIRTRRGINIGVYCVLSSTPEQAWNAQFTQHLRDISHAVMDHLESVRSRHFNRRNERMTRGLGSFIEGKATITGWNNGTNTSAFTDDVNLEGALNSKQQIAETNHQDNLHAQEQQARRQADDDTPPGDNGNEKRLNSTSGNELGYINCAPSTKRAEQNQIHKVEMAFDSSSMILSRATNIIRESFEVEGSMLFDVSVGPQRTPPAVEARRASSPGQSSSTSSSEEQTAPASASDGYCQLLAFSTTDASSVDGGKFDGGDQLLPKNFMAKLLRRYPGGKIFNFDEVGELQTSDHSEDDIWSTTSPTPPPENSDSKSPGTLGVLRRLYSDQQPGRLKEGQIIHKAFPNARSVAFMPIWDSKRQRWFAGGFLYTFMPTRIFTVEGELSFLQAFSMIAATEVLNLEALKADKSKSDTLGSLSHELRSPLHGVILGTELLNDTDLNVFQENSVHTIETCCRTLLDTMDHLLDYSKINSLTAKRKTQEANMVPSRIRKRTRSNQLASNRLYSNVRLDGLVEEVVEGVFAGFNLQHRSVGQLSRQMDRTARQDIAARQWLDSSQAREQLQTNSPTASFGEVAVYILVDPTCSWAFSVETGAVRRIIMNLFGNSLKYTTKGSIKVSLSQIKTNSGRGSKAGESLVQITVQDTGRGISNDYLQHSLFKPFAQEDELAPGTGLGLSIVKQITSQLHGKISVTSHIGRGTTATVRLPLQVASSPPDETACFSDDDALFEEQVQELTGLRIRLVGFGDPASENETFTAMRDLCSKWLHVDLITDSEQAAKKAPDVVLWSDDALPAPSAQIQELAKRPNVVICQDALVAYDRFRTFKSVGHDGIFEFVSQPTGARKLAKFISLAYKRWMGLGRADISSGFGGSDTSLASQARRNQSSTPEPSANPQPSGAGTSSLSSADSKPSLTPEMSESPPDRVSKILVVDDNQVNLKVLSTYLRKIGFDYAVAMNGQEAVDTYTSNPGDYIGIVMDISMPVMDGYEATRAIRSYEHKQTVERVPIVALTGLASDEAHNDAIESGMDVFLTKPVKLQAIKSILESIDLLPKEST